MCKEEMFYEFIVDFACCIKLFSSHLADSLTGFHKRMVIHRELSLSSREEQGNQILKL